MTDRLSSIHFAAVGNMKVTDFVADVDIPPVLIVVPRACGRAVTWRVERRLEKREIYLHPFTQGRYFSSHPQDANEFEGGLES